MACRTCFTADEGVAQLIADDENDFYGGFEAELEFDEEEESSELRNLSEDQRDDLCAEFLHATLDPDAAATDFMQLDTLLSPAVTAVSTPSSLAAGSVSASACSSVSHSYSTQKFS